MLQSEDIEAIEAVVAALRAAPHLTEIELRQGDRALILRRPVPVPQRAAAPRGTGATGQTTRESPPSRTEGKPVYTVVSAHLVGVFRAHRPHPVVSGDWVKEKQTLGQIESMRLMNECSAPVAGQIAAVLVQDGQPVEYGQPLFEILPDAASEGTE